MDMITRTRHLLAGERRGLARFVGDRRGVAPVGLALTARVLLAL